MVYKETTNPLEDRLSILKVQGSEEMRVSILGRDLVPR
jgi:hypothetical protein